MVDKGKVTRRSALGLIAAGGVYHVSGTAALSNLTADRGTDVYSSDDISAFLGIEGQEDTSQTPTFTNNSNHHMDLELGSGDDVEFDVGDNGNWVAPPVEISLSQDESRAVNIRFVGECTDAGTAAVDLAADLSDGSEERTIELTRDFLIPEAGQVQFTGRARTAGASGKYEFELENNGCADVTFVGIGINETSTDADRVTGGGSLRNLDTGEWVVDDEIPINSLFPEDDTRRDMNPHVPLAQDATVDMEFERFRRTGPGSPNVDMRGQDVRLTFYLSDGSSATIKLCLDGCSI